MLADAGEPVHPASALLANESAHIEDESADHDLHAFQAIRRMDEILVNNFMVFNDVVDETYYDLVIGDEAWDVDYFLHENPELKRFAFAWMTDFVGWLPMPSGGDAEAALTADYNAEMLEQRARYRRLRDRSIFVGNPDDVVDESFGPGLPRIREWTEAHYDFAGYVTGFAPPTDEERARHARAARLRARRRAVRRDRRRLGRGRCAAAAGDGCRPARARRMLPALRFLVVTGPRIDPSSLPRRQGVRVRGFVPGPVPHARRVRRRHRAGRAHDLHGARRRPAPVPLRAAREPLRAELPRAPPARAATAPGAASAIRRRAIPRRSPRPSWRRSSREVALPAGRDRRRRAGRRDAGGADLMRALEPTPSGFVDRDGVAVHYEVYGDGVADRVPAHAGRHRAQPGVEGADPVPGAVTSAWW